ncbi:MAG: biotin synthase BioB [Candidatus Omnitrophica bacterium]|nr:biotin synthase BioB [Candidatus Omnitrophota bacterium]
MDKDHINSLLELSLPELILAADKIRRESVGSKIELCSIINAKSGLCNQDCKFCAQSSRHSTGVERYPLKKKEEMLEAAKRAQGTGAQRFGIVTSGATVRREELGVICDTVAEIITKVGIRVCASLGSLDEEAFRLLKQAGLSRYHHNIETSPGYFSNITITHTFQDRIDTIISAKKTGLQVCSGGIIGMGETLNDRIEMALYLKELNVDSVPVNILVPIKGTPLEKQEQLSPMEAIRSIALFRIILKDKIVRIAAGRESVLKDFQALAFMAGANGMLIGGYLTIRGREIDEDKRLVKEVEDLWRR